MVDVEIFWPAKLPPGPLLDAAAPLQEAGLDTTCRLQPVRRGAELSVLVLMAGAVAEPFFKSVFEQVGEQAHAALARFVRRLLRRDRNGAAPASAVFVHAGTGARFVFLPSLPEEAFRQAVTLDPGPSPGHWAWDQQQRQWLRFEE